ncbi:MAG: hypothetical protein QNJ37_01770 [Crocosphaera sp.]|nr:hypothetical protein [Crocosphaera sp.]
MTEREFQTIIDKLEILERNDQFLAEKLDLYKQVSDEKIAQMQQSMLQMQQSSNEKIAQMQQSIEQTQKTSDAQINAIRNEIKAYQDANKQQLNVSLGVLVTAAVAILVSVILSMTN